MAQISFISPLDQPTGKRRLLAELDKALGDAKFTSLSIIVAYAKSGPLLRLENKIKKWIASGKTIEAIFGVDQQGTSLEALTFAHMAFSKTYITQEKGITFHPKIYLFKGPKDARAIIGSNNLTVGGTETNFESSVIIDMTNPADIASLSEIRSMWTDLLPPACPATTEVDAALLSALAASGVVIGERVLQAKGRTARSGSPAKRSGLHIVPASPLPSALMKQNGSRSSSATTPAAKATGSVAATAKGFAIQIKPHHNGEIFLSKTAALQDPGFFGWPFTGSTVPKKVGNPTYPQLTPDPVVDINVYGSASGPILTLSSYNLNTVYYATKSEIRITASPLVGLVPDYSVMVMNKPKGLSIDYDISIYRPDSPDYNLWLSVCNQVMPSGGKAPRSFGWF